MPSITATVGSASANSYVTETEVDTYADEMGGANALAWEESSERLQLMIRSTRALDALFWLGQKAASTQALQWPRDYVVDPDSPTGEYFDDDAIPTRIKRAQMELVLAMAGGFEMSGAFDSIKSKEMDGVRIDYAGGRVSGQLPDSVLSLIVRLLEGKQRRRA